MLAGESLLSRELARVYFDLGERDSLDASVECHSVDSDSTALTGQVGEIRRVKSGRIGIGGMGEWLKPAVLKTDSPFLADRTNQSKSLCLPAFCADSDFTLVPSFSRVLTPHL
jgi:hypothetical protein